MSSIDSTLPLDADIAADLEMATSPRLGRGDRRGVQGEDGTRAPPARDVAAAIVDEATERGADLLVTGLPYRKRFGGEFAIGWTIPYILQNAPCTVWVVREPMNEEG